MNSKTLYKPKANRSMTLKSSFATFLHGLLFTSLVPSMVWAQGTNFGELHGTVTRPNGLPAVGATVRWSYAEFADSAKTDADGRYRLKNLPYPEVDLRVTVKDALHPPMHVEAPGLGQKRQVDFQTRKSPNLTIVVHSKDKVMGMVYQQDQGQAVRTMNLTQTGKTQLQFPTLKGSYQIILYSPSTQSWWREQMDLDGAAKTIQRSLKAGIQFSGRVVDKDLKGLVAELLFQPKQGIPEAFFQHIGASRVALENSQKPAFDADPFHVRTSKRGGFLAKSLPAGEYQVLIQSRDPKYASSIVEIHQKGRSMFELKACAPVTMKHPKAWSSSDSIQIRGPLGVHGYFSKDNKELTVVGLARGERAELRVKNTRLKRGRVMIIRGGGSAQTLKLGELSTVTGVAKVGGKTLSKDSEIYVWQDFGSSYPAHCRISVATFTSQKAWRRPPLRQYLSSMVRSDQHFFDLARADKSGQFTFQLLPGRWRLGFARRTATVVELKAKRKKTVEIER